MKRPPFRADGTYGRLMLAVLDIIDDVDERVRQVFTEAYHDVAAQFEAVFGRLFPGGEGRLVLTDPDDMLTTGCQFMAMRSVLAARFPQAQILGVFLSRRAPQAVEFDAIDDE